MPEWSDAHLVALARASAAVGVLAHAFQPIWDLRSDRVLGFEALARFPGGEPPQAVWEAARSQPGQLWLELDRASIASALRQARGLPGLLFVNCSGRYLGGVHPFSDVVAAAKAEHRPEPGGLVIELTEDGTGAAVGAGPLVERLRGMGALLALDDADRGAATAGRLAALGRHLAFVKVGPEVLDGPLGRRRRLLHEWARRAAACGARVIAEGIEDRAALPWLRSCGVGLAQGHGLGRPMPAAHWTPARLRRQATLPAPAG